MVVAIGHGSSAAHCGSYGGVGPTVIGPPRTSEMAVGKISGGLQAEDEANPGLPIPPAGGIARGTRETVTPEACVWRLRIANRPWGTHPDLG